MNRVYIEYIVVVQDVFMKLSARKPCDFRKCSFKNASIKRRCKYSRTSASEILGAVDSVSSMLIFLMLLQFL